MTYVTVVCKLYIPPPDFEAMGFCLEDLVAPCSKNLNLALRYSKCTMYIVLSFILSG